MRSLLILERIALNFLQRFSGIATFTANFVAEAAGTRAISTTLANYAWLALTGEICRPVWRRL